MAKGTALVGSVVAFNELRSKGFSVEASVVGAAANEATGNAIVAGGMAVGTVIEPGGGTLIVGGGAWVADQFFGWSDSAGLKAAQQYELRIKGK